MDDFDYNRAFSRNIGWLTPKEQLILKNKTVAIAGMGGVGGLHLITLCRLGLQNFRIADPDSFEIANFNRQIGATMSTINKPKNKTLLAMAKDINPNVNIQVYETITADNVEEFLSGCDIYVDGMDFFAVDARESLFSTCEKLKIPAVTAAPLGMGVNYLIFDGTGMSFMDYFQWKDKTSAEKALYFAIGLAPSAYHLRYLVEPKAVDFKNKKGPSTIMSCMLCTGVTGVNVLKVLLHRGKIYPAPYYHVFDPYLGKFKRGYLFMGNRNPLQKLKYAIVSKMVSREISKTPEQDPIASAQTLIAKVLEIARFAPSGDNTQPWRFKLKGDDECVIYIKNALENDIYDFDGKPTFISVGCLIESIRLVAGQFNKKLQWNFIAKNQIHIVLQDGAHSVDPGKLAGFIPFRSVDRHHYRRDELPSNVASEINTLLDEGYRAQLFTKPKLREKIIMMNMWATQVRLVLKEAHEVHQHVIQWDKNKTDYGIPYTATGLSKLTTFFMRMLINDWQKMKFFNEKLGGAFFASIELDFLPGKNSAGYLALFAPQSIDTATNEELIQYGMQLQRTWLMLTKMNISLQPCFMPIILSYYHRHQINLSDSAKVNTKIGRIAKEFAELGLNDKTIFLARIGYPKAAKEEARSTRLALDQLILTEEKLKK